jgi:ABC-2 type transport system permease protein
MKLQRVLALTSKEVKKTIREPAVLFMVFLFPIVFVVAFGSAFSGSGAAQTIYHVGVVNLDQPGVVNGSQLLTDALSSTQILSLQTYDINQSAQNDLSQGKIQAIIVIPSTFSASYTSYQAAPSNASQWTNTTLQLYVDKGSIAATQGIPPVISQVLTGLAGQTQQAAPPFTVSMASLVQVTPPNALDYLAPGMFAFASIFLIMMVAQSFVQDRENGMFKRIRTTPTTPTEFITSQVISYMAIALIQAALVFVLVYIMGFKPAVGIPAYVFAFVLVLLFSLSNVGFGLIVATIAKSAGAATGLSFLFVLPQMFLGTRGSSRSARPEAGKCVPTTPHRALTSLFLRGAAYLSPPSSLTSATLSASCPMHFSSRLSYCTVNTSKSRAYPNANSDLEARENAAECRTQRSLPAN